MICGFKVRWYAGGKMDSHYVESGYVAGEDYDDCFSKVRDWYFSDQIDQMESIEISMVPCIDDDCDIVVLETMSPENITVNYDAEHAVPDPEFNHVVPDYYDCDED